MAKILVFPLLTMSSGHHKVAEVIIEELKSMNHEVKKIDILSDSWASLEKGITSIYKSVLGIFPQSYEALYRFIAGPENYKKPNFTKGLGSLFTVSMKAVLKREEPDFIICTHGFPSSIINKLKHKNKCRVPVLNIYTDFFINNFWGCSNIEYHFASSKKMKSTILKRNKNAQVFLTGIPINKAFNDTKESLQKENTVLITGGSSGYGSILKILTNLKPHGKLSYNIMCGSNKKLFTKIQGLKNKHFRPLPYLNSAKDICRLYDEAVLIIGKPGGITVTECLRRQAHMLIQRYLPGQEYYNYNYLKGLGVIIDGLNQSLTEQKLVDLINDDNLNSVVATNINGYLNQLKPCLTETLNKVLNSKLYQQRVGG